MNSNVNNISNNNANEKYLLRTEIIINNSINSNITIDNTNITIDNIKEETDNISIPNIIYRFKFSEEFMEHLYNFSKIHQYDDRKDFKEAWKIWVEENSEIVDDETRRLNNLNYDGDIMDKMFKSVRYYFRHKSTEKKEPRQRRVYISVDRELLNKMDIHILENITNNDYQPKTGFIMFCKDNEILLKNTISSLFNQGIKDSKLIEDKIKKTYKNRYFTLTNSNK